MQQGWKEDEDPTPSEVVDVIIGTMPEIALMSLLRRCCYC